MARLLKHLSDMQKVLVYTALVFVFVFMIVVLPFEKITSLFMLVPFASMLVTMLLTKGSLKLVGNSWGFTVFK